MKRDNSGINGIAAGLLIFGIILIIGMIGNAADSSSNRCSKAGCDNRRASGSSYCYIHKPNTGGGTTTRILRDGFKFTIKGTQRYLQCIQFL